MTIHTSHPFPTGDDDPARRLRGRLGGAVSLWTAGDRSTRAGLTVTSMMIGLGPEPVALALFDPDADLTDRLLTSERGVVQLLQWEERGLAEAFAGTAPAPGGPFRQAEFAETAYGPRLMTAKTWAEVSVLDQREIGWSLELTVRLERVEVGADDSPLLHRRGRFQRQGEHGGR